MPLGASNSPVLSQTSDRPQRFGYAVIITGFSVIAAISFVYRIEFYPLTAWHLYAKLNSSGEITYHKVFGHQPSGAIVPVRLEDAIGALRWDGRYRHKLHLCIKGVREERQRVGSKNIDICKKFLTASGVVYNKQASPDRQITHFEIQEWVWDFRAHPSDPEYGNVTDRIVVEIQPVPTTVKKEMGETY